MNRSKHRDTLASLDPDTGAASPCATMANLRLSRPAAGRRQRHDAPDVARVDEREHDVSAVLFSSFFVCVLRFAERDDLRHRIGGGGLQYLGKPRSRTGKSSVSSAASWWRCKQKSSTPAAQHVLVHEVPVLDPPGRRGDDSERRVRHRGRLGHGDEPLAPHEVGRRGGDGVQGRACCATPEETSSRCSARETSARVFDASARRAARPVLVRPRRRYCRQRAGWRSAGTARTPRRRRARPGVDVVERVVSPVSISARLREVRARAVHEHVDHPAVVRHRFFDRSLDLALIGNVRLDRDRVPARVNARSALNGARQRRVPASFAEYRLSLLAPRTARRWPRRSRATRR